ncbi:MAG: DUF2461 domain-containing protein [Prevotella sp.]|jgi:uncharacterized protein (TIGR02453 family)
MELNKIMSFLTNVAANNNRDWFQEHKDEYLAAKASFDDGVEKAIAAIGKFDPSIAHLTAKDCTYRFYRDIRFSSDKSPYKRHFGAYISAHGRKSLHAGYYIHVQPGQCLLGIGAYWLPTNILTSVRNEIMGNIDEWRKCVENGQFVKNFGYANDSKWSEDHIDAKGFGIARLKRAPKGFPNDYEFGQYLKMKDYCAWHVVPDDFFEGDEWLQKMVKLFKVAKPMMDFTNAVIDDYE